MELNEVYKTVKALLDKGCGFDVISEITGLSESDISNFFNGEYKQIKTEEYIQELTKDLGPGERLVRSTPYDEYDLKDPQSKIR